MFDGRMAWHESWDLTQELLKDPTSRVAVSIAGWTHPLSHEAMALLDTYDLLAIVNSGRRKPKPYPRPWDKQPDRFGSTGGRSRAEVVAILQAHRRGLQQPLRRDARGRLHGTDGRFVKG